MLRSISLTFTSKILIAVLNLLVVILLSRHLGAIGKGQASLLLTSVTLYLIVCNIVGGATLVYLVPRYNTAWLLFTSYLWTVISCLLLYLLIHVLHLLPQYMEFPVFAHSILDSFSGINNSILLGKEKIKVVTALAFIRALSILIFLIVFLNFFGVQNVGSYVNTLYCSFGVGFILSLIYVVKFNGPMVTSHSMKEMVKMCFKLGGSNQLAHIVQFMNLRLSYYLLDHFSSQGDLGVFSNGVSLAESVLLISNSITLVQYSKIVNNKDSAQSAELTIRLSKMSLSICLVAVVTMAFIPASFYTLLFGLQFLHVKNVIFTLLPGILFYNIALIVGHYFSGIGKYRINALANSLGLGVTLLLSFLTLSSYSTTYAGVISSISYALSALFLMQYFSKETNSRLSDLMPNRSDLSEYFRKLRNI